jgi:hypothetical protein
LRLVVLLQANASVSNTQRMEMSERLTTVLTGVAGEYFVAAELSRRGYIASITVRNTKGIDILAANSDATKSVGIQVKTNQSSVKHWIMNQKAEQGISTNLFFVFVNLNSGKKAPSFHIVPRQIVADCLRTSHAQWLEGKKRDGGERKDTAIRVFRDIENEYVDRWDLLGL